MDSWGYPSPGRRISQVGYWHDGVCVCVGVGRGGGGGGLSPDLSRLGITLFDAHFPAFPNHFL